MDFYGFHMEVHSRMVNPIELVAEVHVINPGAKQRRIVLSMLDSVKNGENFVNDAIGARAKFYRLRKGL